MAEIHNVRWPEINDEYWSPKVQAVVCVAAALSAWAIVVVAAILIWF